MTLSKCCHAATRDANEHVVCTECGKWQPPPAPKVTPMDRVGPVEMPRVPVAPYQVGDVLAVRVVSGEPYDVRAAREIGPWLTRKEYDALWTLAREVLNGGPMIVYDDGRRRADWLPATVVALNVLRARAEYD